MNTTTAPSQVENATDSQNDAWREVHSTGYRYPNHPYPFPVIDLQKEYGTCPDRKGWILRDTFVRRSHADRMAKLAKNQQVA